MNVEINSADLSSLDFYIKNYFVKSLNDGGVTFPAMALALQTLTNKIAEIQEKIGNTEGE